MEDFEVGYHDDVAEKAEMASNALHVSQIQKRILFDVNSWNPDKMTPELRTKLAITLVSVSELYNDYATALGMLEKCSVDNSCVPPRRRSNHPDVVEECLL